MDTALASPPTAANEADSDWRDAPNSAPLVETRPARFNADQFLAMCDTGALAGRKLELADGEIVEKPLPKLLHARLHTRLVFLLGSALPLGHELLIEWAVRLGPSRVRNPDLVAARTDQIDASVGEPGLISLAVEVADSTLVTDLVTKAAEYAEAGIPHYWVVDPQAEVVHTMSEPGPEGYAKRTLVRFREPLAVPGGGTITIAPDC